MFTHLQDITEKSTIDMLKLKREMKQMERSKQDRNRMFQEKRMVFMQASQQFDKQTEIIYCAEQIINQLQSQNIDEVIQVVLNLNLILENNDEKIGIIEDLFDLNIMSTLLLHIQSHNQKLQREALYLLSILLSEQSDLFNKSFLQKNGTQILEKVVSQEIPVDSIKYTQYQILYCFGNCPSHSLSKLFLEQIIPNILYTLSRDQPIIGILEIFSWFLNSCLDLEHDLYFKLQFSLIMKNEPDLTSEVIANIMIYPNPSTFDQISFNRMIAQDNILDKLEQSPLNYLQYSQVINFLEKLIEISPTIYENHRSQYKSYIEGGLNSSKDLSCQAALKLMTSVMNRNRTLDIDNVNPFLKIFEYRRGLQPGCLKFLKIFFCITSELDSHEVYNFLDALQGSRIQQILIQQLKENLEHPDRFVELILLFLKVDHPISSSLKKSQALIKTLRQIAVQQNDSILSLQIDILFQNQ